MPFLPPNQQHQSTEGKQANKISRLQFEQVAEKQKKQQKQQCHEASNELLTLRDGAKTIHTHTSMTKPNTNRRLLSLSNFSRSAELTLRMSFNAADCTVTF